MDPSSVQLIFDILILGGVGYNLYFQKIKIDTLKTQLDAQKGILDSAKSFLEIFDMERLKSYVSIVQHTTEADAHEKIKEAQEKVKEVLNAMTLSLQAISQYSANQMAGLIRVIVVLLFRIPPSARKAFVEENLSAPFKEIVKDSLANFDDFYLDPSLSPSDPVFSALLRSVRPTSKS
jgi:hypothetical protein